VDSGSEVGCCDGARSGYAVGWGWVNKEDNWLGLDNQCPHRMDKTAGCLAWNFWEDSFYLLADGVGQSRATQVLKDIPRPRRLMLGFYNRGFDTGAL